MRIVWGILVSIIVTGTVSAQWIEYVQPFAGTAPSTTAAALKHSEAGSEANANTIPAVTLPFAMTQWTAQTRFTENKCVPPYFYRDSVFSGIRASHWLSGSCTQDYGSFTFMPQVGRLDTSISGMVLPFSHSNEEASPASYAIHFSNKHFSMAVTATERCGLLQLSSDKDDSVYLLISPNSDYGEGSISPGKILNTITGINPAHRIYQGWGRPAGFDGMVYIEIDNKKITTGQFTRKITANSENTNKCMWVGVFLKRGEQITLRIGTSFTSAANAKANLQKEIAGKTFAEVQAMATATWNKALSQVTVKTQSDQLKRVFYTGMYHTMQQPRLFNDVNGDYPQFAADHITVHGTGNYYDDFSMWDIFRAELPLYEILRPQLANDFVNALIAKGEAGGWLPIFPCWNNYTAAMVGDHASVVIASAFAKGIATANITKAYGLLRKNAFTIAGDSDYANGMGRRALQSYLQYGFIPMEDTVPVAFHKKEQVSRTLEYAYDDYAVATLAKKAGRMDDYSELLKRSNAYTKVFDTTTGMVRGRYANGNWMKPFRPDNRESYITEGTPRQYTFFVPQNIPALAASMGGREQLEMALDSLFALQEYWHGNEPGHHIPFLYNYTKSPWKTQAIVRHLLTTEYTDGPGGLSGNDDAGQMSAWYVFAAMGFYPVDPVSGNYLLTTPLFDEISIQLPKGKTLRINCHKQHPGDMYIAKINWNTRPYTKNYINYEQVMEGGVLDIYLDDHPSSFGTSVEDQPPALF